MQKITLKKRSWKMVENYIYNKHIVSEACEMVFYKEKLPEGRKKLIAERQ